MNLPLVAVIFFSVYFVIATYNLIVVLKKKYFDKTVVYKPNHSQRINERTIIQSQIAIQNILADITFGPSCVDMNWKWECKAILGGYLIRTSFRRPERTTGKIAEGFGRWWFVPDDVSLSGVVKTAYKAAMLILEHELMESFKFRGKRIFNPHNTVEQLASIDESAE